MSYDVLEKTDDKRFKRGLHFIIKNFLNVFKSIKPPIRTCFIVHVCVKTGSFVHGIVYTVKPNRTNCTSLCLVL